jgi:hypothetical protein
MDPNYHDLELLSAEQIERIYQVTDRLDLHRDWVVVPLNAAEDGLEMLHPDGKLLLRPPGAAKFEAWLQELPDRLNELDLGRTPRQEVRDPKWPLTGPGEFHAWGTRRYLGDAGILRR